MDAVILSGGLGTRLRPLTYTRPKPLLQIANRPMLEHLIERLPARVDRIIVAGGYMIDQVRAWASSYETPAEIVVVNEEEALGTGGAIKNVEDEIHGPFLCFNGDVLSTAPLGEMIDSREEADAMGAIALWEVDDPQHYGVVDMDGDRIQRFIEKPDPGEAPSNLINAGTYCFSDEILDHIPSGKKVSLEDEIFPTLLQEGHSLLGIPFTGHWVDTGRPEVYRRAHEILLDGTAAVHEDATMDGAWEDWASIGKGARVAASATLARSILLEGSTVDAGARLEDTILGANATVGKDAHLTDCVVADGEHIPAGTERKGDAIGVDPDRPVGGDD